MKLHFFKLWKLHFQSWIPFILVYLEQMIIQFLNMKQTAFLSQLILLFLDRDFFCAALKDIFINLIVLLGCPDFYFVYEIVIGILSVFTVFLLFCSISILLVIDVLLEFGWINHWIIIFIRILFQL